MCTKTLKKCRPYPLCHEEKEERNEPQSRTVTRARGSVQTSIGGSGPSCWDGTSLLFSGRRRGTGKAKARGARDQQRECIGFLGMGKRQLAHSLSAIGDLGERCSSHSGVRGGAQAARRFSCILKTPDGFSSNLLGAKIGEWCMASPLNSPMQTSSTLIFWGEDVRRGGAVRKSPRRSPVDCRLQSAD